MENSQCYKDSIQHLVDKIRTQIFDVRRKNKFSLPDTRDSVAFYKQFDSYLLKASQCQITPINKKKLSMTPQHNKSFVVRKRQNFSRLQSLPKQIEEKGIDIKPWTYEDTQMSEN